MSEQAQTRKGEENAIRDKAGAAEAQLKRLPLLHPMEYPFSGARPSSGAASSAYSNALDFHRHASCFGCCCARGRARSARHIPDGGEGCPLGALWFRWIAPLLVPLPTPSSTLRSNAPSGARPCWAAAEDGSWGEEENLRKLRNSYAS
jgi:hypothetical protein